VSTDTPLHLTEEEIETELRQPVTTSLVPDTDADDADGTDGDSDDADGTDGDATDMTDGDDADGTDA
jgi:hypothetical protein